MHADKVTAPVMLIASDMDIFPLWQYQEMYTALYRLRKPACLVVYMGEGHWPQSPANVKDLWARAFDWFDFHLRNGAANGCADRAAMPPAASAAGRGGGGNTRGAHSKGDAARWKVAARASMP